MHIDWKAKAACIAAPDPDVFYATDGSELEAARHYCSSCPVAHPCLSMALSVPASGDFGVWGGMTKDERAILRERLSRLAG